MTRESEPAGQVEQPPTVNGDPCPAAARRSVEDLVATLLGTGLAATGPTAARSTASGLGAAALGTPSLPGAAPAGVAVALNETVVPRGLWGATTVRPGDRVEVVTAVQGG